MTTGGDIATWISGDPGIKSINFKFEGFPVWPEAYSKDLAKLLIDGRIHIVMDDALTAEVGAQYYPQSDSLHLPVGFSFANSQQASLLVHELTHAHLDYHQGGAIVINWFSQDFGEAVAYIAEALYREHYGIAPMSKHSVRQSAQSIAGRIRAGAYEVDGVDCALMRREVATDGYYGKKTSPLMPKFHIYDGIR